MKVKTRPIYYIGGSLINLDRLLYGLYKKHESKWRVTLHFEEKNLLYWDFDTEADAKAYLKKVSELADIELIEEMPV